MVSEERREDARAAIESAIEDFQDVYAEEDFEGTPIGLPVLRAWVLVTVHDDAIDPTINATHRMTKTYQSTHESVGLLALAQNDYMRD
jgi:hypothetical protein